MIFSRRSIGFPADAAAALGRGPLPLLSVCFLTACSSPTLHPLTIEVRDAATHQPAPNITLLADVPSKDHPFSVASILGKTGPNASKAQTDSQGRATVNYIPDRPIRLGVLAADWDTGFVLIDPDGIGFNAAAWHTATDPASPKHHQPEFRVVR